MATIANRVQSLTGLTLGDPNVASTTELNVWILDAVVDIVNKSLIVNPQSADQFGKWSYNESATSGTAIPSGIVLEVLRETGTVGDYAKAVQIPRNQASLAKNKDSMMYASKFNPVWYFEESSNENNKVVCLPVTSNSDGERYDIKYVHYSTTLYGGTTALAHGSDLSSARINYFPSNLQYLVILYASIKVLYNYIITEFKDASELFTRDKQDDDGSTYEAESFSYWLSQEDSEMIQATNIAQSGEAQFLTTYLNTLASLKGEYGEGFGLIASAKAAEGKER